VERKRELTIRLSQQEGYPVAAVCEALDLPRSSYYRRATKRAEEPAVQTAIEAVAREFPTYGSRRVSHQLRRPPHALAVNRKRVRRLMRQMGLQRPVRRRKRRTTDSEHPYPRYPNRVAELTVTHPDQVWVCDVTYVRVRSEFLYLAVILDVYPRALRGWQLGRWLDQELTLTALRGALAERVPEIHHSDQGVQYAATAYTDLLTEFGAQISMAAQGQPEENGYAERVIRTIREEEIDLSDYHDFAEARAQIGHFIEDVYQRKRIHSALGYLTPVEFEAAWHQARAEQMFSLTTV